MMFSGDNIGLFIMGLSMFLLGITGMITSAFFHNAESMDEFIGGLSGRNG